MGNETDSSLQDRRSNDQASSARAMKISNFERVCQMQWFEFPTAKHVATTAARGTFVQLICIRV